MAHADAAAEITIALDRVIGDGDILSDSLKSSRCRARRPARSPTFTPPAEPAASVTRLIHLDPLGFALLPPNIAATLRDFARALPRLLNHDFDQITFRHGTPILSNALHAARVADRFAVLIPCRPHPARTHLHPVFAYRLRPAFALARCWWPPADYPAGGSSPDLARHGLRAHRRDGVNESPIGKSTGSSAHGVRHQLMSRPAALALLCRVDGGLHRGDMVYQSPLLSALTIALAIVFFYSLTKTLHRFTQFFPRAGPGGFPQSALASRDGSIRLAAASSSPQACFAGWPVSI